MTNNPEAFDEQLSNLLKQRDWRSWHGLPYDQYSDAIARLIEEGRKGKGALGKALPTSSILDEMKMDPLPGLLEQLGSPPK